MNTKKELSLNTQLSKLREINSTLKLARIDALNLDSRYGGNRGFQIQQFIYSLRDLQYKLRGLKIKVSRSSQVRKMSVAEIYDLIVRELSFLPSTTITDTVFTDYSYKLQTVQILLGSVVEYCNLFKSPEDIKEDEDKEIIQQYVHLLEKYKFPVLNREQIEILRNTLLQKFEKQNIEADELY